MPTTTSKRVVEEGLHRNRIPRVAGFHGRIESGVVAARRGNAGLRSE